MSVVTLNIRVEQKKDSLNRWKVRKDVIYRFVRNKKVDIIGLQEVYPKPLNEIKTTLKEFTSIDKSKIENKEDCPILYKTCVFDCIDQGTIWLSQYPDSVGFIGWDGKHPRFANWAILRHKKTHKTFCFVNTHLDNAGEEARNEGMRLLKERLKDKFLYYPVVLVGDLNSTEQALTYKIATKDEFEFYDSYYVASKRKGVNYSYHAFGKKEISKRNRIDYIFVTYPFYVRRLIIVKEKKIRNVYMSDHNPVIAKLTL